MPVRLNRGLSGDVTDELDLELVEQAYGMQITPECESPSGKAPTCVVQFQMTNSGVVVVLESQTRPKRP